MHRRKLPIGIQTFAKIREEDHYYIDKTGFIRRLVDQGSQYFLSRPRRFGKSLLLDTLAELFSANEPLFRGLQIHPDWDWSTTYPVIRISFAEGVLHSRAQLDRRIEDLLRINRESLAVNVHPGLDIAASFGDLIRKTHAHYGQRVVILVDEYDKPHPRQPDRRRHRPGHARRFARSLLGDQGRGCACPLRLLDRGE